MGFTNEQINFTISDEEWDEFPDSKKDRLITLLKEQYGLDINIGPNDREDDF